MTITPRDAPVIYEFVGQTQSSREVEIRARVDGFLERRVYVEGAVVKAGKLAPAPAVDISRNPPVFP